MKNYLKACSGKIWHSYNALLYGRLTPGSVFVGVLSLILIFLSFIGVFAAINSPHAIAATTTVVANSDMKHTLAPDKTPTATTIPSPTSTTTPSPTSTPTPTATPTMMPTPTSTSIATPTATAKPSPIPTKTTVTPPPPSSTPSISPTRDSSTGITNATPVATSTVKAVSSQSPVQGQTPTTKSNSNRPQSMPQQQQKNTFLFIALAIGVPGITATLVFLLIGWWLLRKHLLPNNTVQFPPSRANPWSRVRPNDTWSTNVNGTFQPDGNNAQLSKDQMPLGNNTSDAYEQWLSNNFTGTPDLNDPYLNEILNQFSDKTRATLQQNLSNFRNE